MKNPSKLLLLTFAAILALVSCGPEVKPEPKPDPETEGKVPVAQTFNVKAGDSVSIEFESYASWTAKSDVEWILFNPSSGEAGESRIECEIGAQKPNFKEVSKGTLSIIIEGKSYDMTFLREASVRATRFTNSRDEAIDKLVFDANGETLSVELTVEANYYWDLDRTTSPWPSWITDPGRTDGKLEDDDIYRRTFTLSINQTEAGETDKTSEITFIDLDDESYRKTLPVEFVAKVVTDQPFEIRSELGTEIHVTPDGKFKDKSGKVIEGKYWLDFTVECEDLSEFKTVVWDAVAYDTDWRSSVNMNYQYFSYDSDGNAYPKFISVMPPITGSTDPNAFSLVLFPAAFSHPMLKIYHWDMGYYMFAPERVWKNFEQYADKREFFAMLWPAGALSQPYMDPAVPGSQATDSYGNLVSEIKENLRKYIIRIYIDKE